MVETRRKVQATVDDSVAEESAHVTAMLKDGRRIEVHVEHAIGSLQKPLSKQQLEAKFTHLVEPVLGAGRASEITRTCRELGSLAAVRTLTALCRP